MGTSASAQSARGRGRGMDEREKVARKFLSQLERLCREYGMRIRLGYGCMILDREDWDDAGLAVDPWIPASDHEVKWVSR